MLVALCVSNIASTLMCEMGMSIVCKVGVITVLLGLVAAAFRMLVIMTLVRFMSRGLVFLRKRESGYQKQAEANSNDCSFHRFLL